MSQPQRTYCSKQLGVYGDEKGYWSGFPIVCGALAAGPHPDPERGYLEPLCARHRQEAERDMLEPEADEALLIEVLDLAAMRASDRPSDG